jgi:C4-dicarboxylate transporter DctM subunit
MDVYLIFFIFVVIFLALIFIGLPIAFSLGALAVVGFLIFLSPGQIMHMANISFDVTTGEALIVVPMFLLMGQVISICDTAEDFYGAAFSWLHWLPGSLAACSTITAAGFAAISGASTASAATVGTVSIPPMLKRNYNKKLACGVVTSGGALGILIPPSLGLVIYGFLTETSVSKLFIAGIVPGLLIALLMVIASIVACMVKPSLGPRAQAPSWKERWKLVPKAIPLLVLASLVSIFLYFGIATVTEVAALGVICSFINALVWRRLTVSKLMTILLHSARTTGMIMLIAIGGISVSFILTSIGLPHRLAEDIAGLAISPWVVLIAINILYLILGCVLDPMSTTMITIPFLFPLVISLGIDPIWFGIIQTINMEIGLLTPPVGVNLYALAAVVDSRVVSMKDIIIGSLYFELILLLGLILIMIFPQLALWLPSH